MSRNDVRRLGSRNCPFESINPHELETRWHRSRDRGKHQSGLIIAWALRRSPELGCKTFMRNQKRFLLLVLPFLSRFFFSQESFARYATFEAYLMHAQFKEEHTQKRGARVNDTAEGRSKESCSGKGLFHG